MEKHIEKVNSQLPASVECVAELALANGATWAIASGEALGSFFVSHLMKVMQLRSLESSVERVVMLLECCSKELVIHRLEQFQQEVIPKAATDASSGPPQLSSGNILLCQDDKIISYMVSPPTNGNMLTFQLERFSLIIAREAEISGGLLLHGALAEMNGFGVILAGPGGIGKTTASRRLKPPWRSLCDDTTLVVHDKQGTYWAHPWPTWKDFQFDGPGRSWDVQHAVPLRGIFFLEQAQRVELSTPGTAHAVCLLTESAEQGSMLMSSEIEKDQMRRIRLQRFENICNLAQKIPSYILRLSRFGVFWEKLEQALNM